MNRNHIRIIGGKWRGRKINFPATETLRPTPDRIRETVFNWLAPYIVDAACLDLFAGSGALCFEALSRGAGSVLALEKDPKVIAAIKSNAEILETGDNIKIIQADSIQWIHENKQNTNGAEEISFDIIFLDPPYALNLLPKCFDLIKRHHLLKANGLIYLESDAPLSEEFLTQGFHIEKQKKAGNVYYGLCRI